MNKVFRSLWLGQSLMSLRPYNNALLLLTNQSQMTSRLSKFGFSEYNKGPPRVWGGAQSSSRSDEQNDMNDYSDSHSQNRGSYDRRSSDRGSYQSRGYESRGYESRGSGSYGYNTSRGFTKPVQEDSPPTIVKDILDQYKTRENAQNHNAEFNSLHSVFIKKNSGKVIEEDFLYNFDQLNFPKEITEVLVRENFTIPSPIQSVAIPYVLRGEDMINLAQTGSGKTLAFVIPAILHIMNQPSTKFPRILVLAPTRELAMQIQTQFNLFSNIIVSTCAYGGHPKSLQQRKLSQKNDVIIATPGRLQDFIDDGLPLDTITQVILDEADRMLDMGFEPQIREILDKVRKDKQTLFFSATWPREVQNLAQDLCQANPNIIRIGSDGMTLNKDINQSVSIMHPKDKGQKQIIQNNGRFLEIVRDYKDSQKKILVFCQRKSDTERVEEMINDIGMRATSLHGDLSQRDRDFRMRQYKSGDVQVMIATNLASRGLDIQDIELVVNYDFPDTIEDYIHRIGRTGRAGRSGTAISLISQTMSKKKVLLDLIKVLRQTNQQVSQQLQQLAHN